MGENKKGRKPWFAKVSPIRLRHFLLRCRAALAEPFAQLDLSRHPWDEEALELIRRQVFKVISLFIQLEAEANGKELQTHVKSYVYLEYEFSGINLSWPQSYTDLRTHIDFDGRIYSEDAKFKLRIFIKKNDIPRECFEFLNNEISIQLDLVVPSLANPRKDWQIKEAQEIPIKFWDLRIRLTSFLNRFLSLYRKNHIKIDPFTVFFLVPCTMGGQEDHVKSGFFGYQYDFDIGQRDHLKKMELQKKDIIENPPHLPFPNGVCSQVFLEGRPSAPHDLDYIRSRYHSESLLVKVNEFEQEVLMNGILLEIPVYTVGMFSVPTDGPEIIITIRVPTDAKPLKWKESFSFLANYELGQEKKEDKIIKKSILALSDKTFLDGEAQIVRETCQRLIRLYLQPSNIIKEGDIIANSRGMRSLLKKYTAVAKTDLNVLICGPSGTGKSTIAKEIHKLSRRAESKRYKRISAATISNELALSQLFGHVSGAFTGADVPKDGLLLTLDGGTLFLDDIDALEKNVQARLLTYLDSNEFFKLGGEDQDPEKSNVRLICATNESIIRLLMDNRLRPDFLHRINEFNIEIPGLSDRVEDIPELIQHFVKLEYKRVSLLALPTIQKSYYEAARSHDWRGGELRQLRHFICRSLVYVDEKGLTGELFLKVAAELSSWEKLIVESLANKEMGAE